MSLTVNDLLANSTPADLHVIEKALAGIDDPDDEIEVALTALVFRDTLSSRRGLLDAFISDKCKERIDLLVPHLEAIGASEHAAAITELRSEIPHSDEKIKRSNLIDWLDVNPNVSTLAEKLTADLNSVDNIIWTYLQDCDDALFDIPLPTADDSLLNRFVGFFTRPGSTSVN